MGKGRGWEKGKGEIGKWERRIGECERQGFEEGGNDDNGGIERRLRTEKRKDPGGLGEVGWVEMERRAREKRNGMGKVENEWESGRGDMGENVDKR
jgi:hypothetical protein